MTSRIREVACALAVLTAASVLADDSVTARGAAIAATCSTCHHAGNEAIPPLDGRPAAELLQRLEALAGDPQATVMARIAGALSDADRRAVAAALAAAGHG
jgi:cytochrome c553